MKLFSGLKQSAVSFLEQYKTKGPASYAAAEQAVGLILITDGFIGIENPFGSKKRPGIFGTISGIILGAIFMFIPNFFGNMSGINNMTNVTPATVVSVGSANHTRNSNSNSNSQASCSLTVSYSVNGKEYSNQSPISSSDNCSLSAGQIININYNPANPGSWAYGAKTTSNFLKIFFWAGLLVVISSTIKFFIRLLSIIFGWKLLKDGRRNAASLPSDTNLQTMIGEIRQNFIASIFGFGAAQSGNMPVTPPSAQGPTTPNI